MEKVAVFGLGKRYARFKPIILKHFEIVALADNNAEKYGQTMDGVPVVAPEQLCGFDFDYVILSTAQSDDMRRQLLAAGIPDDKIKLPQDLLREQLVGAYWGAHVSRPGWSWWEFPAIHRHINRLVCGIPLEGSGEGLNHQLAQMGRRFRHGVSVGCGSGRKELALMKKGLVERFTLFELSAERLAAAWKAAEDAGLAGQVECVQASYETFAPAAPVDFVHWNNSLHHMMDAEHAIRWSRNILCEGGVFYMDDYTGPSRFQYTDAELAFGTRVLEALPSAYLHNKFDEAHPFATKRVRPRPEDIAAGDPSEAADSGKILDMVSRYFPEADITLTGGAVYHGTLSGVLSNIDEQDEKDNSMLAMLLMLDEFASKTGIGNHYATALAVKK